MHASAYMCIHAGPEISVSTTDPTEIAEVLQQLGEHAEGHDQELVAWRIQAVRAVVVQRFKRGDSWPRDGLWLVGQLCGRGWEVFQVNQGDPTGYHLRRTA